MYLWRRAARPQWWTDNEPKLRAAVKDQLAIIERPNRKQLQLEVASSRRDDLENLAKRFGGRYKKLPRDWLKQALRQKTKPIKVGNNRLTIPAGAAFGTGEHATTAMCLRLLEKSTRKWRPSWSIVDLGTGSGILAMAALRLGAKRAVAIDNDPTAIRVAKENARLNKIDNVTFRVADVRRWKFPRKNRLGQVYGAQVDIVVANLFSELLIETLPRLKSARSLILSGFLRSQERDVTRELRRNNVDIVEVQRRGKWVAILARCR
jgi:ribosomal protein L11 methyltransferase